MDNRQANEQQEDEAASQKPLITPQLIIKIVALLLIGLVIFMAFTNNVPKKSQQPAAEANSKPSYQTLLPGTASIEELGGWRKLTPPNGEPFFSYGDTIGKVPITVSQQQLPVSFQSDTNKRVAEMARAYNATTKLNSNDITAYIGTSSKGPQSVIFTKNNLLIMIQSRNKISNSAWKKYISSLSLESSSGNPAY